MTKGKTFLLLLAVLTTLFPAASAVSCLAASIDDGPDPEPMAADLFHPRVDLGIGENLTAVANGDFNGDGYPDLAVCDYVAGPDPYWVETRVRVILGQGDGTFGTPSTVWSRLNYYLMYLSIITLRITDINQDSEQDVLVGGGSAYGTQVSGTAVALLGNGDGTFVESVILPQGGGSLAAIPMGFATGDLDHDSDPDLCVSLGGAGLGGAYVLLNNGDGTFGEALILDYSVYASVAAVDLNGDTHLDMALVETYGEDIVVFPGVGDGNFGAAVHHTAGGYLISGIAADLNQDALPDMALIDGEATASAVVLPGLGDGTFGEPANYALGNYPVSIDAADFNGDLWPEIATANETGDYISVLIGNGDGTFGDEGQYATLNSPKMLSIGDFNKDSFPDLAAAGSAGLSVFYNLRGTLPGATWAAASTVHTGSEPVSRVLNLVILLAIPAFSVLFGRGRQAAGRGF